MERNPLFWVRAWSVISCIFAVLYAIPTIQSGKVQPMPAFLSYLFIGILGALVSNVLVFQQRRISELERLLSKRS